MKNGFARHILAASVAAATLSTTASVLASDELVVYAFQNGNPGAGITVLLDGKVIDRISGLGSASFDLEGGAHSIQLKQGDAVLHGFRFNSAGGQNTDISVTLVDGKEPRVAVESYFRNESSIDRANAPTGILTGRVSSGVQPVEGAVVSVKGSDLVAVSAADGSYSLELPRGIYDVKVDHESLGQRFLPELRIVAGVSRSRNVFLSSVNEPSSALEEVFVVAKPAPAMGGEDEQFSKIVVDTMGMEQLARFGDADVAASVVRMPSVTVQDGKFVFVRGLGGRYISSVLNGATMPSTDPTKRTVPLDLFPSNIVESLDVKKSFSADMPGESTGGSVSINTRTFPEEAAGKVSVSLGYNTEATGVTALVDPIEGQWDWAGVDYGTRSQPAVKGLAAALDYSDYYSAGIKQEIGRVGALLLMRDMDLDTRETTPNASLAINYGDVFYFDDFDFGFFAAANYKNSWSVRSEGVSRTYTPSGNLLNDFTFEQYTNNIDASGLVAMGINIGDSSYQSNTIVSRSTESGVKISDGLDGDSGYQSHRYSISWVERQFVSQQFAGDHLLGDAWTVQWQGTVSQATRIAPDRREIRFDQIFSDGSYQLGLPDLVRRFDDLVDDNLDGSISAQYDFDNQDVLKFGLSAIKRERDSDSDTYGFRGQTDDNEMAPNLLVSDVINEYTITGDASTGVTFQEKTLPSDSYQADMTLNAAYFSYETLIADEFEVIAGVRYEDYEQTTDTFSLQGDQSAVQSVVADKSALPSLTLNWLYSEDQQLRFAVSRTASRPDFKETSNAAFYDTEFDFRVRGNPDLDVSEVTNFDVRWENYWSESESASVALFYKDIKKPIERVELPASGTAGNSRTFENANDATLYGVEFDMRREYDWFGDLNRSVFISTNASYIKSEVTQLDGRTRKLQGQPEYTFNLVVGYDDIGSGQEITFLINQNGEAIKDVGISGSPDVIEKPRLDLKLNYKWEYSDDLSVKVKVSNLLDSDIEFTQGGQVFQSYKKGIEFQAGIDLEF